MSDFHFGHWFRTNESPRALLIRYCTALSVVAGAMLSRLWLDPYLDHMGFALSIIGMLGTAWVGGLGPSLIGQTLILFAEAMWFNPTHEIHSPFTVRGFLGLLAFYSVGGIVGLTSDAWRAARKRVLVEKNEALAQREQLCATLSCVGDGVLVTDAEGRLTLMNPVAEAMTAWTFAEAKGKPVRDVFAICDEQSQDPVENPVQRVLREGQVLHETMRLILTTRSDHRLPVAYSAAPIHDAHGKTTGVVLIVRDESERRHAETALRNADQRKDEFLATLAHELRNPLAPICMGLELMKISADEPSETADVRSMMERQTQQMVRLIDDLLDVSRITCGKLELRRCQVRLDEVVRNAVDATRPAINDAKHQFSVTLPDNPILLDADPSRLTQVLSNLLNNAARYTPNGGRIELTATEHEADVIVAISDNGRGIPSDKLGHVFDMFTQVHGAAETGQTGLGIGLTLVKRLVELHGGTVEAESAGPNLGARFSLRLPALRVPAIAKEKLPRQNSPRCISEGSRRILVVDDNEDALISMSMLISALGNEVYQAHDGFEAIELAEQFRPEIVLMDIGMPGMNGYEAARRIRSEQWGQDVVLIAITGWGQEEDRRRTSDAGFDHHLVKPIELATLQDLLAELRPAGFHNAAALASSPVETRPVSDEYPQRILPK